MKTILCAAFLLMITGCVPPQAVYTLNPSDPDVQWVNGVGLVNKNINGITLSVGYIESRDNIFTFDVFIKNESERTIMVDPVKFECTKLLPEETNGSGSSQIGRYRALDPEQQIQNIDVDISKENADYESFVTWDAVGTVADFLTTIITVGSEKTDEEIQNHEIRRENARINADERKRDHENRIGSLNDSKAFWQSQAMRKTTLPPNESNVGRVLFKSFERTGVVTLRFPIEDYNFEIQFEQKEVGRQ